MTFDVTHYTAAVFDLDGTVWLSEVPIPGAVEFVDQCRRSGLTIMFATNATQITVDHLSRRLFECGLGRPDDILITSGTVVARTALVLCSDESSYFTGSILHPDGGFTSTFGGG